MGTTAEKLAYLKESKNQIKQALGTPSNVMRDYANWIKKYVDNQPTKTVSDGICTNALDVPLVSLGVDGNSEQNRYEGYNILNPYEMFATQIESGLITVKDDGTVVLNGTFQNWSNGSFSYTLKAGTYSGYCNDKDNLIIHFFWQGGDTSLRQEKTIILTEDKTINGYITNGTYENIELKPMIYEGEYDSNKSYEPYTGGQSSPNPNYKQDIEVIDTVNLNNVILKNGQINSTGNFQYANNRITNVSNATEYVIKLNKGTYTINAENLDFCSLMTKDNNNNNILDNYAKQWNALPFTFTLNQDGYLFYTLRKNDNSDLNPSDYNVMLTKGTTPKPYLPHGCIGLEQSGKNLLAPSPAYSETKNGVTVTSDGKGKYTLKGTSIANGFIHRETIKDYTIQTGDFMHLLNIGVQSACNCTLVTQEGNGINVSFSSENKIQSLASYVGITINKIDFYMTKDSSLDITLTPMIVNSPTVTTFEEYYEPKLIPINLNGNSIAKLKDTDIKDILNIYRNGNVEIGKKVNKLIINGERNYTKGYDDERQNGFYVRIEELKKIDKNLNYVLCGALCNYLIEKKFWANNVQDEVWGNINTFALSIPPQYILALNIENINTIDELKTWLSSHNLEIYYPLAEQYQETIPLPSIEPIQLWEGTNIFKLITNLDTTFKMEYIVNKDYLETQNLLNIVEGENI